MRCLSHISSHTCWKVQAYTHSRISQLDCLGDLRHPPPLTPTYTKLASTYYTFRNSLITRSTTVSLLTQKSPQLTLQIQLNPQASESQMPLAQREQRKQPCAPQTLQSLLRPRKNAATHKNYIVFPSHLAMCQSYIGSYPMNLTWNLHSAIRKDGSERPRAQEAAVHNQKKKSVSSSDSTTCRPQIG